MPEGGGFCYYLSSSTALGDAEVLVEENKLGSRCGRTLSANDLCWNPRWRPLQPPPGRQPAAEMCPQGLARAQSCPTLCDPVDCSPPGSSVLGMLQARILEWVATSSSSGSSPPRDRTRVSCVSGLSHFVITPQSTEQAPDCHVRQSASAGGGRPVSTESVRAEEVLQSPDSRTASL